MCVAGQTCGQPCFEQCSDAVVTWHFISPPHPSLTRERERERGGGGGGEGMTERRPTLQKGRQTDRQISVSSFDRECMQFPLFPSCISLIRALIKALPICEALCPLTKLLSPPCGGIVGLRACRLKRGLLRIMGNSRAHYLSSLVDYNMFL